MAGDRDAFSLPAVDVEAPPIPPTVQPKAVALPSFVTSNDDFYRIDTALTVPQLSRAEWQLQDSRHGRPRDHLPLRGSGPVRGRREGRDADVCVQSCRRRTSSRMRPGRAIGCATCWPTRVCTPTPTWCCPRRVDGFTAGTPVEALTDGRDALLAVGMNGQPLPTDHGYPARLVVPGLYGYVSATKWVVDLELTRFDRAEAYWTRLGWSPRGPIKTESRIDVPRSGAGRRPWAGDLRRGGVGAEPRGAAPSRCASTTVAWRQATAGCGLFQ